MRVQPVADQIGNVLEQNPTANTSVPTGSEVTIVVATEPGTVEVPDVVGDKQEDAIGTLQEAGLEIGNVTTETPKDTDIEPGEVISTDPKAGEKVEKGTKVVVVVAGNELVLDDYNGVPFEEARQELFNLGFRVRQQPRVEPDIAPGTVVGQNPRQGSRVDRGSTVTLIVAVQPDPSESPTEKPSPTDEPSPDPSSSVSPTDD